MSGLGFEMYQQPTALQREIVERWLADRAERVFNDFEDWYLIATSIPPDVSSSDTVRMKSISSIDLSNLEMLSLSQTRLRVSVHAVVDLSVQVDEDDYERSQEVRHWVGEWVPNTSHANIVFAESVLLTVEVTTLEDPPTVTAFRICEVGRVDCAGELPPITGGTSYVGESTSRELKLELGHEDGRRGILDYEATVKPTPPDFPVFSVPDVVGRVFRLYETLHRSLAPFDLFAEMGGQLVDVIRQFGGYRRLVERMNTIDEREVVLDPAFSDFDPLEGTRGIESLSLLEARASDIFRHFEELLDAIAKANLTLEPRLNRRGAQWPALLPSNTPREYVEVIHACTTELLNKMAHAYMLRPAIVDCAVDCSTLESTKVAPVRGAKRDVFQYLAANSRLRDSYAVANSLRILIGNLPQQAHPVSY